METPETTAVIDRQQEVREAAASRTAAGEEMAQIQEDFALRQQKLQLDIEAGLVSEIEARKQVIEMNKKQADELEKLIPIYEEIAKKTGAASDLAALERLRLKIVELRTNVNELKQVFGEAFEQSMADALFDLATGVTSLGEAARQFILDITESLARWAAEGIANQIKTTVMKKIPFGEIGGMPTETAGAVALETAGTAVAAGGVSVQTGATALGTSATVLETAAAAIQAAAMELQAAASTPIASGAAATAAGAPVAAAAAPAVVPAVAAAPEATAIAAALTTAGTTVAAALTTAGTTAAGALTAAGTTVAGAITAAGTAAAGAIAAAAGSGAAAGGATSLAGLFDFSGAGFAGGGYTGGGGKFDPAGIVHKGEYVFSQEDVQQPGMLQFLAALDKYGLRMLKGYAEGGRVAEPQTGGRRALALLAAGRSRGRPAVEIARQRQGHRIARQAHESQSSDVPRRPGDVACQMQSALSMTPRSSRTTSCSNSSRTSATARAGRSCATTPRSRIANSSWRHRGTSVPTVL